MYSLSNIIYANICYIVAELHRLNCTGISYNKLSNNINVYSTQRKVYDKLFE